MESETAVKKSSSSVEVLDLVEIDADVVVRAITLHGKVHRRLIDTRSLRELAVVLEISGLVSVVFVDDVHLVILELTKTTEHNVTSAHPNLLTHLPPNVPETGLAVKTVALAPPVTQHAHHLAAAAGAAAARQRDGGAA